MGAHALRTGPAIILPPGLRGLLSSQISARGAVSRFGSYPSPSDSPGEGRRTSDPHGKGSTKCPARARDGRDRIKRDPKAVEDLSRTHPKPLGCNCCEVDCVIPLTKGGKDEPTNIQ
jgi:hypothetical protein